MLIAVAQHEAVAPNAGEAAASAAAGTPPPAGAGGSLIDEIVRDGARRMLAAALEAEGRRLYRRARRPVRRACRRLVVRSGHAVPRQVLTCSGVVEVAASRVNDKRVDETTGQRGRFAPVILPAWCRKSPKTNEVLPLLYLHGLSSQDFAPAPETGQASFEVAA